MKVSKSKRRKCSEGEPMEGGGNLVKVSKSNRRKCGESEQM